MTVALVLLVIAVFVGFRVALSEFSKKVKHLLNGWKDDIDLHAKAEPSHNHQCIATCRQERRKGTLIPPNLDTLEEDTQRPPLISSTSRRDGREQHDPNDILDLLALPATLGNEEVSILARTFSYVSFILKRQPNFEYPDVSAEVLKSSRVREAIHKASAEAVQSHKNGTPVSKEVGLSIMTSCSKKAVEYYEDMKSCMSPLLLRISGWVIYKLLGRMLSGVKINKKQIEMLHSTPQGIPVIYLPLHRSHLDYTLVTFILYMNDLRVPLVAAGNNLNIPLFGALLRGLGAFFIKRKLDPVKGQKDYIYRAILHTYMEQALHKGHSLEFFIEGGRSRTGKSCLPKGGLLSVVVNSFLEGAIPDAILVPVAISYEKLVDGNFISEQMGHPKIMENFWSAITAIWRIIHSNFGYVKVDFGTSFSLKEFLQNAENFSCLASGRPNVYSLSKAPPMTRFDRAMPKRTSLYGTDIVIEDQRKVIKDLAEHVLFDAVKINPIMTTNVLSLVFLTIHRRGVSHETLVSTVMWLQREIEKRQHSYFTIDSQQLVKHALSLLGPHLVNVQTVRLEVAVNMDPGSAHRVHFYSPTVQLPNCLELQYYAQAVTPLFIIDSILVRSYFALKSQARKHDHILGRKLIKEAFQLCNILQYEFLFTPPNANIYTVLISHLDWLLRDGVFLRFGLPHLDEEENNSDEGFLNLPYKVKENSKEPLKLKFLMELVQPYIETYAIAAKSLSFLIGKGEVEENLLVHTILQNIKESQRQKEIEFAESAAVEPIKNALKLFENWEVLGSVSVESKNLFYLHSDYETVSAIHPIYTKVKKFL